VSPIPAAGNNTALEFMTDLVFVGGSLRVRELLGGVGGAQGQEHSRLGLTCQRLK
jgi:hypothetical protein